MYIALIYKHNKQICVRIQADSLQNAIQKVQNFYAVTMVQCYKIDEFETAIL